MLGGTQIYALQPGSNVNFPSSLTIGQITLDPEYTKGSGRLCGIGVEVINTTSDLNRQGVTTVWRQQESAEEIGMMGTSIAAPASGATINFSTWSDCKFYRPPPFSVANAMLYPGSRQWKAADGAYLVGTFSQAENPPQYVGYLQPVVPTTSVDDIESTMADTSANEGSATWTTSVYPDGSGRTYNPAIKLHPINMFGAMFTGLSIQTTLTINVNHYYETFPSVAEPGILVLAKPSAAFDPVALEFMSRVNSTLPVGVPASWNPDGEWFWEVVNDLVDMAPQIGSLFGPVGRGVGTALQLGYDALSNRYNDKEASVARESKRATRQTQLALQNEQQRRKKTRKRKVKKNAYLAPPGNVALRPKQIK
jgi:hypothetical protein